MIHLRVWRRLPEGLRNDLVGALAREWTRREAVGEELRMEIARALSFRPSTLDHLDEERRRDRIAAAIPGLGPEDLCAFVMTALEIRRPGIVEEAVAIIDSLFAVGIAVEQAGSLTSRRAWRVIREGEMEAGLSRGFQTLCTRHPVDLAATAMLFGFARLDHGPRLWARAARLAAQWYPRRPAGAEAGRRSSAGTSADHAGGAREASSGEGAEPGSMARDSDPSLPRPPSFTTLDRVLIRAVAASADRVEGSLPREALEDLVREVVALNDSRSRSWLHLGFLDRLHDRPLPPRSAGDDDERRSWYLAGWVLGAMRRETVDAIPGILDALDRGDRTLLLHPGSEAGELVAAKVFHPLLEAGAYEEAIRWMEAHGRRVPVQALHALHAWSEQVLAEPTVDDTAVSVLEFGRRMLAGVAALEGEPMLRDLEHRRAIALWRSGRDDEVEEILEGLLEEEDAPPARAVLLAHSALVLLGLRRFEDLAVPVHERERAAFEAALELFEGRILDELLSPEMATDPIPRPGSPLPYLCLGFLEVARAAREGSCALARATGWLRTALDLMTASGERVWSRSGLRERCSAYLAMLELWEPEPDSVGAATDRLCAALDAGAVLPEDILLDTLESAVQAGAPGAEALAEIMLARYAPTLVRSFSPTDIGTLFVRSSELRTRLWERLEAEGSNLSAAEAFRGFQGLLAAARAASPPDEEAGSAALDGMERLARDPRVRDAWRALLMDEGQEGRGAAWEPFWDRSDRDEALFRLALIAHRREDAVTWAWVLYRDAAADGDCERARGVVEALRVFGHRDRELEACVAELCAREEAELEHRPAPGAHNVRVVFVGGNETQRRQEQEVRAEVERLRPGTRVDFAFPGWSSNSGRFLKRIGPLLDEADAVVIMRFVRTELGRRLRRIAGGRGIPWVACTGHGRDSMIRAVVRAVDLAHCRSAGRIAG